MLHTIYKNLPQNDQKRNVKYRWSECIQRARTAILVSQDEIQGKNYIRLILFNYKRYKDSIITFYIPNNMALK